MTFIRFNHAKVREFLIKNKQVYTLRVYTKYPETCTAIFFKDGETLKIGTVTVSKIKKITNKEMLTEYLPNSGFSTLEEWYDVAKELHGSANFTLYSVKI